ncbi:hypothetical protein GGR57DRAFT_517524 [Xylariaceae sp. FL1272]|nr:hypothetical protein GGR57DRAFT_517524 [Xylariaceae sp. FL1272]
MARRDSTARRSKVLVRYYWYSRTKRRVLSPNVDLHAPLPKIIARPIYDGFKGEPQEIESAQELRNDHENESNIREDAADGVYISPQNICWVPGFEAKNGDLYTIISSPGKEGYKKEERIPVMVQRKGHPEDTRQQLLALSKLSTLKRVSDAEGEEFLEAQSALIRWQRHAHQQSTSSTPAWANSDPESSTSDEEKTEPPTSEHRYSDDPEGTEHSTEDLCQCLCQYSDLGMTWKNPRPWHWHIPASRCPLGSAHSEHCIFARERPNHCVISSSNKTHRHCRILNENLDITAESSSPPAAKIDEMIRDSSAFPDLEDIANEDSPVYRASPADPPLSPDRPTIEICHPESSPTLPSVDSGLDDCANSELVSFPEPEHNFRNIIVYHDGYRTPEPWEFQL